MSLAMANSNSLSDPASIEDWVGDISKFSIYLLFVLFIIYLLNNYEQVFTPIL